MSALICLKRTNVISTRHLYHNRNLRSGYRLENKAHGFGYCLRALKDLGGIS